MMTVEQLIAINGALLCFAWYWVKDWKDKVDEKFNTMEAEHDKQLSDLKTDNDYALAVKQKELDILFNDVTTLKIEMERRIKREELDKFKGDLSSDIKAQFENLLLALKGFNGNNANGK